LLFITLLVIIILAQMTTDFLEFFKRFSFLSLEDLKLVYSMVRIKKVSKGERIVSEGEVFYFGIVILKGLLRNYVIMSTGEERTVYLAYEGMQTACPESIFRDKPSTVTIEALEPSLLLYVDTRKLDKLAKNRPVLLRLKIRLMEDGMMQIVDRVKSLTDLTPEERYLNIRDEHPALIHRVPQKYLASYIGVTPTSLSRMRARMVHG
jgi:CRP-like cAMP-binding protein